MISSCYQRKYYSWLIMIKSSKQPKKNMNTASEPNGLLIFDSFIADSFRYYSCIIVGTVIYRFVKVSTNLIATSLKLLII